jgi:folate-binding protein YgfZ
VRDANEGAQWIARTAGVRALDDVVLRVTGEDARTWLAGQVTNDTHRMAQGDAVYALVLDARGKILSDVWVLECGTHVLLVVPGDVAAALREHFEKYIVMEDVELGTTGEAVLTVQGPQAGQVVERAGLGGFPCDRLGLGGRDVIVPAEAREDARVALASAAEALGGGEVDEAAWELARLRAGRPRFAVDFGPANYPQEAGLKAVAVSFRKGCYLGQEVVCTLENRGQLSRHLVHLEAAALAAPGTELRLDDKVVGNVTSAVYDPEAGHVRAMGYVKRAAAVEGTVLASDIGTAVVRGIVAATGHDRAGAL